MGLLRALKELFRTRLEASSVPEGWVVVADAPNRVAAGMIEGLLKGEGITVMVMGVLPMAYGMGGGQRVMVPADLEERARGLVEQVWPRGGKDGGE